MKTLGIFLLLLLALVTVGQFAREADRNSRAEAIAQAAWISGLDAPISQALAKGHATGCGEYRYLSLDRDAEYMVECFDGNKKRYYHVWPKIGEILGPYDRPLSD